MMHLILPFLVVCFSVCGVWAQTGSTNPDSCSGVLTKGLENYGKCEKPVVFGDSNNRNIKKIRIDGVIEDVTLVPISCGVYCYYGTAKIRLSDSVEGYKDEFIYLVVACFHGKKEDFVGKRIKQEVIELSKAFPLCGPIYNVLDSNGNSFYVPMKGNKLTYKLRITKGSSAHR